MIKYAFWNNKGGTGKTSLNFQTILSYAIQNPNKKILAIDVCPQANLSELMLGGLVGQGSENLLKTQGHTPRASVGGYFQFRLPQPYSPPSFNPNDFIILPNRYNSHIPENIHLLPGDPLLELQVTAISTLANNQIPGINTWLAIIDWLHDFLKPITNIYDIVFIDCNPSFAIYTQIALSTTNKLIIPVMADDSSRRALQNVFSLIYGFQLPSPIYAQHSFASKLIAEKRILPKVHLIVKNRLTQYMGPTSAYSAVLCAIEQMLEDLKSEHSDLFTFDKIKDVVLDMRDFGTTGVVAFAKGQAFERLKNGRHNISGRRVQVNDPYRGEAIKAIKKLVELL